MIVRLLSGFICALPLAWALWLGRFVGWLWYYFIPIRRAVARHNIERALGSELTAGQRRAATRRCYTHLALYGVEILRNPLLDAGVSEILVDREGFEYLQDAVTRGTGAIVPVAHFGNLDLMGMSQAVRGLPLAVVAKELGQASVDRFIHKQRSRVGVRVLPPRRSRDMLRATLNEGMVMAIAFDQHLPAHRAVVCELFGMLAATTPAPARFALETGVPVHPAALYRDGLSGRHTLRIEPELPMERPYEDMAANIRHNTERLNRVLERWIRSKPEQWLWLHRRWKVQDDPRGWDVPDELRHLDPTTSPAPPLTTCAADDMRR